jgi:hypothetical protein
VSVEASNGYSVRVQRGLHGWEVRILDPEGGVTATRHCGDEAEARTYASTVQQHIFWLSPDRFREYYRLDEPA